ncbi:MAG: hypothetical protein Q8O82_18020 [Pseudorhodobacter sp.]|nr:hypothetical protein [Pseudorhodobacter sp.]
MALAAKPGKADDRARRSDQPAGRIAISSREDFRHELVTMRVLVDAMSGARSILDQVRPGDRFPQNSMSFLDEDLIAVELSFWAADELFAVVVAVENPADALDDQVVDVCQRDRDLW